MWMTTPSALLLPLGIWLVLSAATPKADEQRVAVSGMIAALFTAVAFAATGFGFMAGQGVAVSIAGQAWDVVGNTGFLVSGTPMLLTHFAPQLALALACVLLINSVIARRINYFAQGVVSVVVGGVLFPIASKWVLGGGWLAALGRHLNFGHGAVDFGGLATVGWVAGMMGLAFIWVMPRKQVNVSPSLPSAQFPFRAVSGVACVLIGSVVIFGSNTLPGEAADKAALSYFINLCVACAFAALSGLLYSRITSPQADVLCAARATVAAVIMVSSGAGALPIWVAASLGIAAGLLATVGLYIVQEKLGLDDDSALITSALLPGMIGFLATGIFATGSLGAGWNGVGDAVYLAVPKLGVVGLLPMAAPMGDPGQLTAQLIAIASIGGWILLGAGGMAYALRPQLSRRISPITAVETTRSIVQPPAPVPAPSLEVQPIQVASVLAAEAMIEPEVIPEVIPVTLADENIFEVRPIPLTPVQLEPEPKRVFVTVINDSDKPKAEEGLLVRLRRLRRASLPEQPARARKVAYPTRVNGKRLIRPLVDETSPKP